MLNKTKKVLPTSRPFFFRIFCRKKTVVTLTKFRGKKLFYTKKVTRLPDLTVRRTPQGGRRWFGDAKYQGFGKAQTTHLK